jgi:hypothetical protein
LRSFIDRAAARAVREFFVDGRQIGADGKVAAWIRPMPAGVWPRRSAACWRRRRNAISAGRALR